MTYQVDPLEHWNRGKVTTQHQMKDIAGNIYCISRKKLKMKCSHPLSGKEAFCSGWTKKKPLNNGILYIRNDYSNMHSNHILLDSKNSQELIRIFSINIVTLDQMLKHPNKLLIYWNFKYQDLDNNFLEIGTNLHSTYGN